MGKPHMTSPNFGENFRCINQKVVVQRGSKFLKDHSKRIKLRKSNYANKSTDKELFYHREYSNPIIPFESFSTRGKKSKNQQG